MTKRKLSSSRYHLYAILLFVAAIALYLALLAPTVDVEAQGGGAPQNVDAAGNAQCAASWQKFYQEAVQKKQQNPEQYANEKNKAVPCGSKCPGKCDLPETGGNQANVCRGDGGTSSCPSAEGGGGMPPMPPMPMPKMPMPPQEQKCPDGSPKPPGGTCTEKCKDGSPKPTLGECPEKEKATTTDSKKSSSPFANFMKDPVKLINSIFGGDEKPGADVTKAGGGVHTFEGQIEALAHSADPESPANKGVRAYITGKKKVGETPLTPKEFITLRVAAEADPQGFAEQVRRKFPTVSEINNLLPVYGTLAEGPAGFGSVPRPTFVERIANAISNWVSGLFR